MRERRSSAIRRASPMTGAPAQQALVEPVLDMDEIQGIVVPGFFKPHQTLVYVHLPRQRDGIDKFRGLLREFLPAVATAAKTLKDRREHRQIAASLRAVSPTRRAPVRHAANREVLVAMAFSAPGLLKLTPGASEIPSPAFQGGMAARASLLGDPRGRGADGSPANWVVGRPGEELDLLIIVAGDERELVSTEAEAIIKRLLGIGALVAKQDGDAREGKFAGHEHFGFDDGVSQPGIRGRASVAADDFVTNRHIDPSDRPAAWLYGYPGQDLVWPGEFVLGYPATGPDPLLPGPLSRARPAWTRNGSFLVYRRLRQDVGLFWRTMRDEAGRLAKLDGFQGLTEDRLAALLVGRWRSGAPFNRVPLGDNEDLGKNPLANNNFLFDSDSPKLSLMNGQTDPYDMAKADPVGITCPWGAHIRKVNVRDSGSDIGGRVATYSKRLLRVGVPFGQSLEDHYGEGRDPQNGDRGLLFLSIQSSIENQFEFLQARWMNDPSRPKMPGGNDMIVGQNAAAEGGVRRCTIFGSGLQQEQVSAPNQWVIPTGGGYFFVPSITALREVIAR